MVIRELNKTAYSGVRMTILGSREHSCIHPTISRSFNKSQVCQELMDKKKGGREVYLDKGIDFLQQALTF